MEKKVFKYNFVNSTVTLFAAIWFMYGYKDIFFDENMMILLPILLFMAALVHTVKAGRLYLALYGSNMKLRAYLKTYCKVTPITMILPFKIGEFFRMYCYGKQIGNVLSGVIVILLDRFMDTMALVTVMIFIWMFGGGKPSVFAYILLIFLVFVLLMYYVFPEIYKFWKMYLLRAKASVKKLWILKLLEILEVVYREIENVTKGCGIILYFMSLIAWGIEIGSAIIIYGMMNGSDLNLMLSRYLATAMIGSQSMELNRFVFASVIVFIIFYLVLKVYEIIVRKKA